MDRISTDDHVERFMRKHVRPTCSQNTLLRDLYERYQSRCESLGRIPLTVKQFVASIECKYEVTDGRVVRDITLVPLENLSVQDYVDEARSTLVNPGCIVKIQERPTTKSTERSLDELISREWERLAIWVFAFTACHLFLIGLFASVSLYKVLTILIGGAK